MIDFKHTTVRGLEMPYKLSFPDGLVVEVDTSTEFHEAMRVIRPLPAPAPLPPMPQGVAIPLDASILRSFIRGIVGRQRAVLTCLHSAEGSVRDEELRAAIGVDDNAKLGGTMAGLSKRAIKIGLTMDDIILKES